MPLSPQLAILWRAGRRARRRTCSVLLACAVILGPQIGHAQRDLTQTQTTSWYTSHASLTAVSLFFSFAVTRGEVPPPLWTEAWGFERRVERNYSPATARASDVTLSASMISPFIAFAGLSDATLFANSSLVYVESMAINIAANSLTKFATSRTRPIGHNEDPRAVKAVELFGADVSRSFYSGHASTSFGAAAAGGYLFSASDAGVGFKAAFWGLEMALAGFTAHARVRAGNHYPTDVVVGSLAGAGIGVLVPIVHEVRAEMAPAEIGAIAGGLATGVGLAWLFPASTPVEDASVVPLDDGLVIRYRGRF